MSDWTDKTSPEPKFVMRSHRRQFVIGSKPFHVYEDWCCHSLDASTWISYCPELRAGWTRDADGVNWVLLGLAVETIENKPDPLVQIAQTKTIDIPTLYPSWAGRWVLIGRGIHIDASGLLGCFYGTVDNQTWVSSSPALLAKILGVDVVTDSPLRYEVGISWFAPPRSRFAQMYRLLPSQVLELNTGNIHPRPLMPPIDPTRSYNDLDLLQNALVTAMQRLPDKSKLWLGLTAGFDSRLILAIARCAKIDVMPFTRITKRMSVADRVLPPKLAHECGYEHIFMRGSNNRDRQHLVAEHSADHVSQGDAEPFIQGVRDNLSGISFGGHGFSVASGFGDLRLLPDTVTDAEIGANQIAQVFQANNSAIPGLRDWLAWVIQHPQENLDWRDRFFLEQRQAGWLSSKEQLYDLVKLERFPILNAARNYSLLLGFPENQRLGSKLQVEMIRRLAPALLKYPFNPPNEYFGIRAIAIKSADDPLYLWRRVIGKLSRITFATST